MRKLLIGSLVFVLLCCAVFAETDKKAIRRINDIRLGRNTKHAIVDLYVRDDARVLGNFSSSGNVTVVSNLAVWRDATFSSNVTVNGDSTFNGNVAIQTQLLSTGMAEIWFSDRGASNKGDVVYGSKSVATNADDGSQIRHVLLRMNNDTGQTNDYVVMLAQALDTGTGTVDGQLVIQLPVANTLEAAMQMNFIGAVFYRNMLIHDTLSVYTSIVANLNATISNNITVGNNATIQGLGTFGNGIFQTNLSGAAGGFSGALTADSGSVTNGFTANHITLAGGRVTSVLTNEGNMITWGRGTLGLLTVLSNASFNLDVGVGGTVFADMGSFTNSVNIGGVLTNEDDVIVQGRITAGLGTFQSNVSFNADVGVGGTLFADMGSFTSSLFNAGILTNEGNAFFSANANVDGTFNVGGAGTASNNWNFLAAMTANVAGVVTDFDVGDSATIGTNIVVNGYYYAGLAQGFTGIRTNPCDGVTNYDQFYRGVVTGCADQVGATFTQHAAQ